MSERKHFSTLISEFQNAVLNGLAEDGGHLAISREGFNGQQQMHAYIYDYRVRLVSVVEGDYPATLAYLGEKGRKLVQDYVEATPSKSHNINHYPWEFANFLHGKVDGFAEDLAKLEAAVSLVYHAEDSQTLTLEWLAQQPEEYLMSTPLPMRTAFKLLGLTHDAETYFSEFRYGNESPKVSAGATYIALCRHENRVERHRLSCLEFSVLNQIVAGETLTGSIESLMLNPAGEKELEDKLQDWLGDWINDGFFRQP